MPVVTARLLTTGMHCSSCSMLIDMTLADLDGVVDSKTDHGSGESVVIYDDEAVTIDGVIGAIASVGYEAELQS
jgi:copper chaperone CopZ